MCSGEFKVKDGPETDLRDDPDIRKLNSEIPGMTYKTVTPPRSTAVKKRDECVFSQIPKRVRKKSIEVGTAAMNNHFTSGSVVDLKGRINGYNSSTNTNPAYSPEHRAHTASCLPAIKNERSGIW